MDVELPDGTVIEGIPEGTTKEQLAQKLQAKGFTVPQEWMQPQKKTPLQSAQGSPWYSRQNVRQAVQNVGGAVVEPIMQQATGFGAKVLGDVAGLGAIPLNAMGLTSKDPRQLQQDIQQGLTYQPRTAAGQSQYNPLNFLPQLIGKGIEAISPEAPQDSTTLSGVARNALRDAIPQAVGIAGMKYGPKVANRVAELGGKAAQSVVGATTGTGSENLRIAYQAGKEGNPVFVSNLRGEVPVEQVLQEAKSGIMKMQGDMYHEYKKAKTGWAADKTTLDFKPIDKAFNDLELTLKQNGHSLVGKAEQNKINEVKQVLKEWRNDPKSHTTLGLDALKQRLDAIYPDSPEQAQAQRVITGTRNAVKDAIVKQAPDYAGAMKEYETRMETIRDIQNALSLKKKSAVDTAMKKLQSLTRNNVNTNYGYRGALADQLESEGGVSLRPALAGQALSSNLPRGLATIPAAGEALFAAAAGHPAALAGLPFASPRLMGEAFYGAGRASKYVPPFQKAIGPLSVSASQNALRNLVNQGDQQ